MLSKCPIGIAIFATCAMSNGVGAQEALPPAPVPRAQAPIPSPAETGPPETAVAPATAEVAPAGVVPPNHVVVDTSPRWPADVVDGINGCKSSMTCPTLLELKNNHDEVFMWIANWCRAEKGPKSSDANMNAVCKASVSGSDTQLGEVSILQVADLAANANPPQCSGFGLVLPLYSIRYGNGGSDVKGPVAAGLGGGYYWVPQGLCRESFSTGPELFGYSEGLDPSGLFHVGIAAGVQVVAYKYFQFGLDVGYDIYRRQPGQTSATGDALVEKTGLLAGAFHKSDWSALITFSVVGASSSAGKSN